MRFVAVKYKSIQNLNELLLIRMIGNNNNAMNQK